MPRDEYPRTVAECLAGRMKFRRGVVAEVEHHPQVVEEADQRLLAGFVVDRLGGAQVQVGIVAKIILFVGGGGEFILEAASRWM